jgi:hypothetical protein
MALGATVPRGSGPVAINRVIRDTDALLPWLMFVLALGVLLVLFTSSRRRWAAGAGAAQGFDLAQALRT